MNPILWLTVTGVTFLKQYLLLLGSTETAETFQSITTLQTGSTASYGFFSPRENSSVSAWQDLSITRTFSITGWHPYVQWTSIPKIKNIETLKDFALHLYPKSVEMQFFPKLYSRHTSKENIGYGHVPPHFVILKKTLKLERLTKA